MHDVQRRTNDMSPCRACMMPPTQPPREVCCLSILSFFSFKAPLLLHPVTFMHLATHFMMHQTTQNMSGNKLSTAVARSLTTYAVLCNTGVVPGLFDYYILAPWQRREGKVYSKVRDRMVLLANATCCVLIVDASGSI